MSKPMYRLVDGKGRVLIPKSMREAAKLEYGDIVCLGTGLPAAVRPAAWRGGNHPLVSGPKVAVGQIGRAHV